MIGAPTRTNGDALADWAEASLIVDEGHEWFLPYAHVQDAIEAQNLVDSDSDAHILLSDLKRTVQRRHDLIGDAYPVRVERDGIMKLTERALLHDFLVLVGLGWLYDDLKLESSAAHNPAKLFEEVVAVALAAYVGGTSFRFGAPRRLPVPTGFKDALEYIGTSTNECLGNVVDFVDGHEKDQGLDIIAWRPFSDRRPGQVIAIAQCAIGVNWRKKLGDLPWIDGPWSTYLATLTTPTRVMAIPGVYDADRASWNADSKRAGMILDRVRLEYLMSDQRLSDEITAEVKHWCRRRIIEVSTKHSEYLLMAV